MKPVLKVHFFETKKSGLLRQVTNKEKCTFNTGFIVYVHYYIELLKGVRFMVFNATFNNISVISWWSVLLMDTTGVS
jgi:hypothetical protein